ncbi:pyridoxamine 5'-phosphate oxidase family protein [Cellulosimicrobium sp. NPDC057862]|uniref:pyridoxamine 5'-phosphate oxidase family protein n=1 Tax=Cellulosimicrobium sp. NPDC057862 TaxID=3346266 RepID=UPI00366F3263
MTDTHHELPHAGSDEVEKVRELVKDERIAMLTTVAEDGSLVSRPMGVQAVDFDGDLWFFAATDSHKVAEIARDSAANAAFSGNSSWVSLSGRATLVHDPDKVRELWNAVADAWFPDGPDTPGVVLIRLHAESAEYWDSPGGRVATLFSLVKAKVTGRPYEGGENETVEL